MKYRVTVMAGAGQLRHVDLDAAEARVGRASDCEVRIDPTADMVSQHHGRLLVRGGQLVYEDRSSNGTFHRGRRVETITIDRGTVLQLGRSGPHLGFDLFDGAKPAANKTRVEVMDGWVAPAQPRSAAVSLPAHDMPLARSATSVPVPQMGAYASPPPLAAGGHGSPLGQRAPVYVYAPVFHQGQGGEKDALDRDAGQLKVLAIFYGILVIIGVPGATLLTVLALAGLGSSGDAAGAIFFLGLAGMCWFWVLMDALMAYALATHRWHTYCVIMAVLSCLEFPLGTILGVCGLVVLTRATTKRLFTHGVAASRGALAGWAG